MVTLSQDGTIVILIRGETGWTVGPVIRMTSPGESLTNFHCAGDWMAVCQPGLVRTWRGGQEVLLGLSSEAILPGGLQHGLLLQPPHLLLGSMGASGHRLQLRLLESGEVLRDMETTLFRAKFVRNDKFGPFVTSDTHIGFTCR